jgi:hypothetical protein
MDAAAVRFRMSGLLGRAQAIVESAHNDPEKAVKRIESMADIITGLCEAVNFLLDRQMYQGSAIPMVKTK